MILVALGSNLPGKFPDCEAVIAAARQAMAGQGIEIVQFSSVWLTAPVPVSDQPWYRNAVAQVCTALSPVDLLKTLKSIENAFGRTESARNAARILDLDILSYNGVICTENDPVLPHPRLHERGFVLFPLQEIAPEWTHPVFHKSVSVLIDELEIYPHVQKQSEQAA